MSKWIAILVVALACAVGSAPASALHDRDNDPLPDRWEHRYGLSTTEDSAKGDPDGDKLRNRREYRLRTSPRKRDTDADGYADRVEIGGGTNPRNAAGRRFPNPSSTGVPANWTPARTRAEDLFVTKRGAVVEDMLLEDGADIIIDAPNVTIRRVKLEGGWINNFYGAGCENGLLIADTTLAPRAGQDSADDSEGVVSYGGYTARRVEIDRRSEGFRVGGKSGGCGPVRIEDSYARITPPEPCGDWHGDGIQGYDGNALTVRNVTLELEDDNGNCYGTAPYFYPAQQGNTSANIHRLLVSGGGMPFRHTMPGRVTGLKIVKGSWVFEPTDVDCSLLTRWDADIVRITPEYQIAKTVRRQRCRGGGQ